MFVNTPHTINGQLKCKLFPIAFGGLRLIKGLLKKYNWIKNTGKLWFSPIWDAAVRVKYSRFGYCDIWGESDRFLYLSPFFNRPLTDVSQTITRLRWLPIFMRLEKGGQELSIIWLVHKMLKQRGCIRKVRHFTEPILGLWWVGEHEKLPYQHQGWKIAGLNPGPDLIAGNGLKSRQKG